MPVAFVILALFVGAFVGLLALALACAAHDREVLRRDDAGQRARRPVADGRYVEVELARRQPRRPRATPAGRNGGVASLGRAS
jgi:hypothetical protein